MKGDENHPGRIALLEREKQEVSHLDWRPCESPAHFHPEWGKYHEGDAYYRVRKVHGCQGGTGKELDVCKRFVDAWVAQETAYCADCFEMLHWRDVFTIIEVIGS